MKRTLTMILLLIAIMSTSIAIADSVVRQDITITYSDGTFSGKYTGEVNEAGEPEGYGYFEGKDAKNIDFVYVGQWIGGMLTGSGWKVWENGEMSTGKYKDTELIDGHYTRKPNLIPYQRIVEDEVPEAPSAYVDPVFDISVDDIKDDEIQDTGSWTVKNFVDEFKQPTDEKYVTNSKYFIGEFSNSATDDSLLKAGLIINKGAFKFMPMYVNIYLYEYGDYKVKGYGSSQKDYTVTILTPDGKKTAMLASLGSNYLTVKEFDDCRTVISALAQEGPVSFYIYENNTPTTNYRFTIEDNTGFMNAYQQMIK